MIYQIDKHRPKFNNTNFIAPNATVIGRVVLEKGASVWFNVVIRGDNDPIVIGKNSNIQDGSILHTDIGAPLNIGEGVTVGHKVMLHGCTISKNCLIGINSTILNHAVIGKNSIVGANSLITEGKEYPNNVLIMGSPATPIRELREAEIMMIKMSSQNYVENGKRFMESFSSV